MRLALLGAVIATVLATLPAAAERRFALVIGIDDYQVAPKLQKAVGDARALQSALVEVGFEVDLLVDADHRKIRTGLSAFTRKLRAGDTALLHFSGHGVQLDGENYLLAADFPDASTIDKQGMKEEGFALNSLMQRFRDTGVSAQIFIVDACRNNPYAKVAGGEGDSTRAIAVEPPGLARIPQPPKGTFVMFSAGTNQLAKDRLSDEDPETTSIYTRTLLRKIGLEGKGLTDIAREVREEVERQAKAIGHDQTPAYYDELSGGQFFFRAARAAPEPSPSPTAVQPSTTPPAITPPPTVDGLTQLEAFNIARSLNTVAGWDAFLAEYKSGYLPSMARQHRQVSLEAAGERQGADRRREAEREQADQRLRDDRERIAREQRERERAFREERERVLRDEREKAAREERDRVAREKLAYVPPPSPPPIAPPLREPERISASSRAGWMLDYSAKLLTVSAKADDIIDPDKRSYTTIWNSKEHGDEVVIYVQVSPNTQCRSGAQYAEEQIAAKRGKIGKVREVRDPSGQRQSFLVEGRGFLTNRGVIDRATIDYVLHRRGDPSTIVHIGGRFPPETSATYKAEILRMLNSMSLPKADLFKRLCAA